jgi:putative SOS response-associated peptidase YedK
LILAGLESTVLFAKSMLIFQFAPLTGLVQVIVALSGAALPELGAMELMAIAASVATSRRFDNGIVDHMLVTRAEPAEGHGNIRRMTQRLVIPSREEVDSEHPVTHPWWQFSARFNVAVTHSIPVARMHEQESEGVMMRWGLVRKSPRGDLNFSSRETVSRDAVQTDEALRTQWQLGQRGIVPLAGFYLWQRTPAGHAQPYYVRLVNRPVFGVAALWDRVETDEGDVLESCVLISVDANPLLAEIDNVTRLMPVIVPREKYATWLSASVPDATPLMVAYPQAGMVCHPVGPHVNHLEFQDAGLIRPITLQPEN